MVRRMRALPTLASILILSLVLSMWLAWKAGTETGDANSRNAKIETAFKLLAADTGMAARSRDPMASVTTAYIRLDPHTAEDWDDDDLQAVRSRAIEAIESFMGTSRIEMDAFEDEGHDIRRTGDAVLAFDPTTWSLLIQDASVNLRRVGMFLDSLGFLHLDLPTPTPKTPTPRLRPIS